MKNNMSTKFVSKNSNFMVVLRPGVEGNRALGTHAKPGLYVRFQGGTVDVKDEEVINMLREHPAYNNDFLEVKESELDPFNENRDEIEPSHVIQEIKYGHIEKVTGTARKNKLSPELKKLIEGEAFKMLPGLLKSNPKLLQGIIMDMAKEMKAKEIVETVKEEAPASKPVGRPKKEEKTVTTE